MVGTNKNSSVKDAVSLSIEAKNIVVAVSDTQAQFTVPLQIEPTTRDTRTVVLKEAFDVSLAPGSSARFSEVANDQSVKASSSRIEATATLSLKLPLTIASTKDGPVMISSSSKTPEVTVRQASITSTKEKEVSNIQQGPAQQSPSPFYNALKQELRFLEDDLYKVKLQGKYRDNEIARLQKQFEDSGAKLDKLKTDQKLLELAITGANRCAESFENENAELSRELVDSEEALVVVLEGLELGVTKANASKENEAPTLEFEHGGGLSTNSTGLEKELEETKIALEAADRKLKSTNADLVVLRAEMLRIMGANGLLRYEDLSPEEKGSQADDQEQHINSRERGLKSAESNTQDHSGSRGSEVDEDLVQATVEDENKNGKEENIEN